MQYIGGEFQIADREGLDDGGESVGIEYAPTDVGASEQAGSQRGWGYTHLAGVAEFFEFGFNGCKQAFIAVEKTFAAADFNQNVIASMWADDGRKLHGPFGCLLQ